MVNWSILTSNVYCLAKGEADRNNKLMSTSLNLLRMCNNYSLVPYSAIPCSGFYRLPTRLPPHHRVVNNNCHKVVTRLIANNLLTPDHHKDVEKGEFTIPSAALEVMNEWVLIFFFFFFQ